MTSPPPEVLDADALRHLKTVVVLFALASVAAFFVGLVFLGRWPVAGTMALAFGATSALVALGLRRKSNRSRQIAWVLAALLVPVVPVGTAFGLYVLSVVGTRRGRHLFNDKGSLLRIKPYVSIIAAQVALATCVAWASVVLTVFAWPMLVEAHQPDEPSDTEALTEETQHQPRTQTR